MQDTRFAYSHAMLNMKNEMLKTAKEMGFETILAAARSLADAKGLKIELTTILGGWAYGVGARKFVRESDLLAHVIAL